MADHERVFQFFVSEVQAVAAARLRSIVVYGSALSADFQPGRSDYNFLVVAERADVALLDDLAGRMGKWRRQQISAPLIMQPEFLQTARDAYPLELLSIQARYRVLHGEDPVAGLEFSREHVRLQCEREIRSKLLLFRRAYLESEGAPKRLQAVIARGYPSLLAIFRGLLWLKGGPWQADGQELRLACTAQLSLPADLIPGLQQTRADRSAPSREEAKRQIAGILATLGTLAREVDAW